MSTFPVDNGSLGTQNSRNTVDTGSDTQTSQSTGIVDVVGREIPFTIDTFLQSLPGSLSTILADLANNIIGQLPQIAQDLLSSTALSGVLSGAIGELSNVIAESVGNLAGALQDAAGSLLNEIGEAITEIPGIGPVIQDFAKATGDFANNLSRAYSDLPPDVQAVIQDATVQIGAGILNDNENLRNLSSLFTLPQAEQIRKNINFADNPANDMQQIATQARNLDQVVFQATGNAVFANLSSKAQEGATQIARALQGSDNGFSFKNVIPQANRENIQVVINGELADQTQLRALREDTSTYLNRE